LASGSRGGHKVPPVDDFTRPYFSSGPTRSDLIMGDTPPPVCLFGGAAIYVKLRYRAFRKPKTIAGLRF
jgi:hypothetical protein